MKPRSHSAEWAELVGQSSRKWSHWATDDAPVPTFTLHHLDQVTLEDPSEVLKLEQFSFTIISRFNEAFQSLGLRSLVFDLARRVEELERAADKRLSSVGTIQTFAPEPYLILKPIEVSIQAVDDGFEAFFLDANIGSSGENEQEAFDNVKSMILDIFDSLSREAPEKLGPEPTRQLAVLRNFIGVPQTP